MRQSAMSYLDGAYNAPYIYSYKVELTRGDLSLEARI